MHVHRSAVRTSLAGGTALSPSDLTAVLLVREEDDLSTGRAAPPMPTLTVREIPHAVRALGALGVRSVKIFAGSRVRDALASQSVSPHGLMMRAIREVKETEPDVAVTTETCVCSHTESAECYLATDGRPDVEATGRVLAEQAVAQAEAGADIVGPAAMIPGTTAAVRAALDEAGQHDVAIMPHLIFDSVLYEGYRTTMRAAPASGQRAFQILPGYPDQAVQTGLAFVGEGADMLLLEPGLFTLDTLVRLRRMGTAPLMPFAVSGEYRWLTADGDMRPLIEAFTVLKRAGAERIVTYGAAEVARAL
ncbi:hypothetical protein [Streptomyces sp. NPDC049881]|uniref:hypothetical protein n=1 Tax=Streptomyces sp. NPDC049881 TaxID=3155778 RepID=UPI003438C94D